MGSEGENLSHKSTSIEARASNNYKSKEGWKEGKMNLASDILDKYTQEQVIDYLDSIITGVLKNYRTAVDKGTTELLFSNLGDIAQVRAIVHEMHKRNAEREARKRNMEEM